MPACPLPADEALRQRTLDDMNLVDTPAEHYLDTLVRLTQERLLTLLVSSDGKLDLSKIGKTVAELVKASVTQKKFAAEAAARRAALQEAASVAEGAMASQGMSQDAIDAIKWAIDAVAYDTNMASDLIKKASPHVSKDAKEILAWAGECVKGQRPFEARPFLRDALTLIAKE